MKIIILGAGQVGSALAENLSHESHDVSVVDIDVTRLRDLQDKLDIRTITGKASYPSILRSAGAKDADMLIAVTNNDEINMVACQVAHSLFNTPVKIARIRSRHYFIRSELFGKDNMPIDVFISPEMLVTNYIKRLIEHPGTLQVLDFASEQVKLVAIRPYYGGLLVGKSIAAIREQLPQARIVAIFRDDHAVTVNDQAVIEVGDEVFCVAASKNIQHVMASFRRVDKAYKRIMIAGSGHIAKCLAQEIEGDYQIKLIEKNAESCARLAEELHETTVICGDVADRDLLVNENIDGVDIFCALTGDDEDNIMSCMLAKKLGARQVMGLISRTTYVDVIEGSGINVAISPQQASVSSILAYVRKGDVVSVHSLRRGAAEAIEAVAHGDQATSQVVGRSIAAIKLPKATMIGAIVRGNEVILPNLHTIIESCDHVILFVADKKHIRQVERLFQVSATFI